MNLIPGDGDGVEMAREKVVQATQRAEAYRVALIALASLAVVISSASAVFVGLGNRRYQRQIRDCTETTGKCYQKNQKATASAVQSVLDYIDASMSPHRLRNEAENECQVELFAGLPAFAQKGVQPALDFYDECVLRRSGNTAPPPSPQNPLTTTTTRR